MDEARESAALVLDQTAYSIMSGSETVSGAASSVAQNLGATAGYIHRADLKTAGQDIAAAVKRYPWLAVAAAVLVGILLGRIGHDDRDRNHRNKKASGAQYC